MQKDAKAKAVNTQKAEKTGSMTVLDELVAGAVEDAGSREQEISLEELKKQVRSMRRKPLDAARLLRESAGVPVIAEIKRASPSKGHLADIKNPAALARQYANGGASAISVLTEGRRFLGSLDDLRQVRQAVGIPVLNKNFIVADYQVWESRAKGADMILLIVAALDDTRLKHLLKLAGSLGMTALVETHDQQEIERAVAAGARVVGINAAI